MEDIISKHTVSVLVDNEPGVLARVIGLISGRHLIEQTLVIGLIVIWLGKIFLAWAKKSF